MGLETGTYISDFNTSNPTGSDNKSQGDDHLRLLKTLIQTTFPGADLPFYISADRADVASASTTDIGAATTQFVNITGTTTITGLGTCNAGVWRIVRFNAALTLTHDGTALILPGAASITTVAGDMALFFSRGSGNWQCVSYQRGAPLYETGTFVPGFTANDDATGVTFVTQIGRYVRIGRMVTVWITIELSDNGVGVGDIGITNLPYTSTNDANAFYVGSVVDTTDQLSSDNEGYTPYLEANSTIIRMRKQNFDDDWENADNGDFQSDAGFAITLTYPTG